MVVPADWKEVKVADVIVDSFSGPSPTCLERNIQGEEWGVFKTTCSTIEQGWDYTKHKVLPRAFWGMTRSLIEVGDTVITKAGPRHRVGVASYVNRTLDRLIVSGKMIGLRPNKTVVCPPFLALALSSKPTQEFLNQRTTGMAESQVNFENVALLETPLYLPPVKEQEAIAEALSDADVAIESLDALITKKRDVKQATMQQLLTGRTRLPGFNADWKEVRLGDLLGYEQPTKYLVSSSDYVEGGQVPVLTAGKSFLLGYTDETDGIYTNLPTIIFDDFTTATQWVDFEFKVKSSACKMLMPKNGACNPRYIFERLRALNYQTSDHKRHWISVFHSMEMMMPPLKEQEAIAEALTVMDDELEALSKQVSKLRMVKDGMMQDLLTGKVRLV